MKRAYHYYEKSKGKMELFSESRRYECALEYGSRRRPSRSVLLSAESCDLMRDSTRYSIGCCSLTYSLFILFKYCSYRRGFQSSGQNWSPGFLEFLELYDTGNPVILMIFLETGKNCCQNLWALPAYGLILESADTNFHKRKLRQWRWNSSIWTPLALL